MTITDIEIEISNKMNAAIAIFNEVIANVQNRPEYGDYHYAPVARVIAMRACRPFETGKLDALDVLDAIQTEQFRDEHNDAVLRVQFGVSDAKHFLEELAGVDKSRERLGQ